MKWSCLWLLVASQLAFAQGPTPTPALPAVGPPAPAAPPSQRRAFPHWERPAFDFNPEPIVGYRVSNTKTLSGLANSSGIELGGRAAWTDIPLKKGGLGLTLDLRAGGAGGQITTAIASAQGLGNEETKVKVYRGWAESRVILYYKAFRYQLSLTRGILKYDYQDFPLVQNLGVGNAFGMRFLRWLDVRATNKYRYIFNDDQAEPATVEVDSWLHMLVRILPARLNVELGPGTAYVQESFLNEVSAEGYARYFMMKVARPDLPYVGDFEGRLKYTAATTDQDLGRYATLKLAEDDLASPTPLASPEDTLSLSAFFGSHYGRARVGVWANWLTFDYSEKDGKKSHLNRENGLGVFYGYEM